MGKLQKKLRLFKRKRRHVRYLETSIWHLKYEILNDALVLNVNENKVNLFHKYNKRLKLITFFK
mgnify:FL=1|jgi:hypothetical protein